MKTDFEKPKIDGFWLKELKQTKLLKEKDKQTQTITYLMTPSRVGYIDIPPIAIDVAKKDSKTYRNIWSKIYTKKHKVIVRDIPSTLGIVGDYSIEATIDKNSTQANSPINLKITLLGVGSLDETHKFDLDIDSALVYASKSIMTEDFTDGKYSQRLEEDFAIVADNNFVIPSIRLKYLNTQTGIEQTIATKEYNIHILNPKKDTAETIKYIYAILGFLLGILSMIIFSKYKKNDKRLSTLAEDIKRAKNDQELYKVLLPHSDKVELIDTIKRLDENIYHNSKHKIDKKSLARIAF